MDRYVNMYDAEEEMDMSDDMEMDYSLEDDMEEEDENKVEIEIDLENSFGVKKIEVEVYLERYQSIFSDLEEKVMWKTEDGKKIPYSDNPDMDVVKEGDDYVEKPKEKECKKNK